MNKNKKNSNILKNSKIRELIKIRGFKINKESLDELNDYGFKFIEKLIEGIGYKLKVAGKKSIKKSDVKNAFDILVKEENYFEIWIWEIDKLCKW